MSLTKLSLGGNNLYMTSLFPPRESLVSDILAGDGNIEKLFLQCRRSFVPCSTGNLVDMSHLKVSEPGSDDLPGGQLDGNGAAGVLCLATPGCLLSRDTLLTRQVSPRLYPEAVFLNFYWAQESIPRSRYRHSLYHGGPARQPYSYSVPYIVQKFQHCSSKKKKSRKSTD